LREEGAVDRLKDFDVEEAIRAGRDDRDEGRYVAFVFLLICTVMRVCA
jgi:hypothetical protein